MKKNLGLNGLFFITAVTVFTGCYAKPYAGGEDGIDGEDGARGPQGEQGEKGDTGDTGPAGPQGPAGQDGVDGTDGTDGADGAPGPAGPQGPAGADGEDGEDAEGSNVDEPECRDNEDCAEGMICNDDGDCDMCNFDDQCDPGLVCDSRICGEPSTPVECNSSNDCSDGQVCLNGRCGPCGSDDQCFDGMQCTDGCCVPEEEPPSECTSDSQCGDRAVCEDGSCMAVECVDNDDCDTGEFCDESNRCLPDDGTVSARTVPVEVEYTLPSAVPGFKDIVMHVVYENGTYHKLCDTRESPSGISQNGLTYTCDAFRSPLEIPDFGWTEIIGTAGVSGFPNFSGTIYSVWGEGNGCSSTDCLESFGNMSIDGCDLGEDDFVTNDAGGGNYDFADCY